MRPTLCIMTIALGAAFALPAAAQLHAAADANPPEGLKANTVTPAPAQTPPDATKVISKLDVETFAAAEFAFADADKNGKLTKAEFRDYEKAQKTQRAKIAAMNEPTPATPSAATAPAPTAAEEATLVDAQFTLIAGKAAEIDKAAFMEARRGAFAKADADANGLLNSTENAKFAGMLAGKSTL